MQLQNVYSPQSIQGDAVAAAVEEEEEEGVAPSCVVTIGPYVLAAGRMLGGVCCTTHVTRYTSYITRHT